MAMYVWLSMYSYVCMAMYGYECMAMNVRMTMYGYVWLCMAMYGYVWLCMAMYGYVCMAMYGYVWLCMAMYGYVCMAMHGYAWLCILIRESNNTKFTYVTIASLDLSTDIVLQFVCSSTRANVSVASLTIPI